MVFPACRSSNSPRRSGAARAPATAVSRLLVVDSTQKRACSVSVRSAAARRSLFLSSRAAPRAPLLLMLRRRAPATACPCARAAGAWGCPCYLGRLPRPPTNGCAIRVWCVRANAAARCAFGCFTGLAMFFGNPSVLHAASTTSPRACICCGGHRLLAAIVFESWKQVVHSRDHQRNDARLRCSFLMRAACHCTRDTSAARRQGDGAAVARRRT